jgi:hypothetical protein
MNLPRIQPSALFYFFLSLLALVVAIGLAALYKNDNNPGTVLFILRPDTYDKVFPFLLGTVAAGGFALAYNIAKQSQEQYLEQRRVSQALVDRRIQRLQEIYETILTCFQDIRLQRRRIRGALIPGKSAGSWQMRRGLFEEILMRLNEAQLAGERIMKVFVFEHDTLQGASSLTNDEIDKISKIQDDLKSQIGGIQGILRNVLRSAEWIGITEGTSNEESLISLPDGIIKFSDSNASGNLSFRKISEHFDAFAFCILNRIRELESESDSHGKA